MAGPGTRHHATKHFSASGLLRTDTPEEPERRLKRNEPDLLNNPDDRRLWKRLQQIKSLPERDQRAILRMLDNTITANAGEG